MNEYLVYLLVGVGILFLSLAVPGLKVIAEAILKGIMELLIEILKNKGSFLVWFIKTLLSDHTRVLRHAVQARDVIDPTQKVRRATED